MPIDKASDGNVPINMLNQSGVTYEKLKDYKKNVITNGSSWLPKVCQYLKRSLPVFLISVFRKK